METGQRLEGMASTLRSITTSFLPVIGLFLLLLVSLYLMSDATQNSERFGRLYISLLFFNSLILIFLLVMIGMNLFELLRHDAAHVLAMAVLVGVMHAATPASGASAAP